MDFLAFQIEKLQQAAAALLSPGSIFSLPQLAAALAIALGWLAWRRLRRGRAVRLRTLLRAALPRRILRHRSTYADLFYYVVNTFAVGGLIGWGVVSSAAVCDLVVHGLQAGFGSPVPTATPDWLLRAGVTVAAFLGYECGYYVDHWLNHKVPALWQFHKVHHTAEVLTPLTVFRVHPVDTLVFIDIAALAIGGFEAVFIYAVGKPVGIYAIDTANVLTVAFLFLLSHLQHSQFWMPLCGVWGRLFLSPAHHQLHHSADPTHYNCNLGSCLAVFDWLFGTLLVPTKQKLSLKFGVTEAGADPHRVASLLIDPVVNAARLLRPARLQAAPLIHPAE